jgi:hypothetical protein
MTCYKGNLRAGIDSIVRHASVRYGKGNTERDLILD